MSKKKSISPWRARLIAFLLRYSLKTMALTYRVKVIQGRERWDALKGEADPQILCYWHNRVFFFAAYIETQLIAKGFKLAIMTSYSKDGEIGALMGRWGGVAVARGSQTRGASQGARALYRLVAKEKRSLVVNPDGSKGPVYHAKMGAIFLSKLTGCPLLPLSYSVSRYWETRSWDKLIIPKPFSEIAVVVGEPFSVDRRTSEEEMEACRQRLEDTLNEVDRQAKELLE